MAHTPHSTCTIKVGRRRDCGANAHWRDGMSSSTNDCGHEWLSMHMTARTVLSRDERSTATYQGRSPGDKAAQLACRSQDDNFGKHYSRLSCVVVAAGRHAAVQGEYCHVLCVSLAARVLSVEAGIHCLSTGCRRQTMSLRSSSALYCRLQRLY